MLDTFTEDRILTAVQELTTELSRVEAKANANDIVVYTSEDIETQTTTAITAAITNILTNNVRYSRKEETLKNIITEDEINDVKKVAKAIIEGHSATILTQGSAFKYTFALETEQMTVIGFVIDMYHIESPVSRNFRVVIQTYVGDTPDSNTNEVNVGVQLLD